MLMVHGNTPMELHVDLGPMPEDEQNGTIVNGLRDLQEKGELCDVVILAGGGSFLAHRVALAAASPCLHEYFLQLENNPEIAAADVAAAVASGVAVPPRAVTLRIEGVSHAEAVQAMLDCIYGVSVTMQREYKPSTNIVNRDVLLIAQRYRIAELQEQACQWLARGLTTSNILERLVVCEEFGLLEVRDQVLEQLISNPDALFVLVQDPSVTKAPAVLQELLVRILRLLGCGSSPAQAKPPLAKRTAGV
eukprot:TRINITY_DN64319_c0_g1_i1.p1 TRINITY_DN64319_c0_g1~~TRINITY_DN64319_c0_g1_i1.p1  ORF type:complete len:249 (+),score=53.17 TRINITY_DN64319_c0_g1_i1:156-902(+)